MSFPIINGDITDLPSGINVIIGQNNTGGVMGAGVAKAIAAKWPEAAETDRRAHEKAVKMAGSKEEAEKLLLGRFSSTGWIDDRKGGQVKILNLYGQRLRVDSLADCRTDYNAVVKGFRGIAVYLAVKNGFKGQLKVGIPYLMGCGLGGGNWHIYKSIIEATFDNTGIDVVLVKFSG